MKEWLTIFVLIQKSQVTVKYENGRPLHIDTIVISTQHSEQVDNDTLRRFVAEEVVNRVCAGESQK